jgi:NAD+ kinase
MSLTTFEFDKQMIYNSVEDFPTDVDYVISYGGDGTFLDCVMTISDRQIPILGVNSGRLGFLANVTKSGLEEALIDLKNKKYTLERRSLLKLSGMEHLVDYPYALNEIGIQKGEVNMIDVEVAINEEFVASYRGDGVLFATPTGSTAYSLSVGGPIVSPNAECLVIAPVAPHTLTMRPLVIPNNVNLKIKPQSRNKSHFLTLDNRSYTIPNGCEFHISKAEKSIILILLQNNSFYRTLRNKMMWGVDRRDNHL